MDKILWVADKIKDTRRRPFGPPTRDSSLKRRAILKNGEYNVLPPQFPGRCFRYIHDIFTGLVDAEWKWTLQVLGIGFTGGWITFSLIWWLIAFAHSDLHEDHLPAKQAEAGWTPCVLNIHGFPSCFLYSLETQHTTGYGLRAITEECPEAIFILCCQCIFGMIIDGFTVGVVVAKMIRPRLTNYTIQFSRNAVVALRDGEVCLMFRAGDLKKYPLIGASVRAILIQNKRTKEGDILKSYHSDLTVEVDKAGSDPFLLWPITIYHKIDENSPFYRLSAADMLRSRFEIVLLLEGTVCSTGQGTSAQTSYLANEILWGHRFKTMVSFNETVQSYMADYKNFEKTVLVEMPMCSVAELKGDSKVTENHGIKPFDETSNQDDDSLGCPVLPHHTNSQQKTYEDAATQFPSGELYRVSPSMEPLTDRCPPRKRDNELGSCIQRTKLGKSSLNNYEYINYTHLENIPEKEDRSRTPPFPYWV